MASETGVVNIDSSSDRSKNGYVPSHVGDVYRPSSRRVTPLPLRPPSLRPAISRNSQPFAFVVLSMTRLAWILPLILRPLPLSPAAPRASTRPSFSTSTIAAYAYVNSFSPLVVVYVSPRLVFNDPLMTTSLYLMISPALDEVCLSVRTTWRLPMTYGSAIRYPEL